MSRRPIPKSEQQLNAERLAIRAAPYSESHAASVDFAWNYRNHIPDDLRGLVRAARRAYADEVPTKLHEGPDNIGEGGTPKMAASFERYIDAPHATDAPPGERPLASYLITPFRATLDRMEHGATQQRRRAAIVRHITIGGQEPVTAAIMEEAHPLDARLVAEDALRVFFGAYSDIKVDVRPEAAA